MEENEAVVDYAVRKLNVKVLNCNLDIENRTISRFKNKVYSDSVKKCIRILPHVHNLDGFFIAKMQKLKPKNANKKEKKIHKKESKTDTKKESKKESKKDIKMTAKKELRKQKE